MRVFVQSEPFDVGHELATFGTDAATGAIVTFTGIVRDTSGTLVAMEVEHYPAMTEAALAEHAQTAITRFGLTDALVIHRYGRLIVGEPIMMVATASPHRKAAFEAAEYLMDWLKSRAPFWKKEITTDGAQWVAAKDDDERALGRW